MDNHKFVFIGGLHRSGTSVFFKCLREHPLISGFIDSGSPEDEGQHLQSVYTIAKVHGGPGKFGFDPSSHLDETSKLVSENNAQKLFTEWGTYWDLEKPFLLEKSPPNLVRTRFLQALFPESYFIILLRHPIAVTFAEHKYRKKTPIRSLLEHWLVCHERLDSDKAHLKNVCVVKYEDFVAASESTLKVIFSFLGIDNVPIIQQVRSNVNDKYFVQWEKFQNGFFTRSHANQVIEDLEERVNHFGYDLKNLQHLTSY